MAKKYGNPRARVDLRTGKLRQPVEISPATAAVLQPQATRKKRRGVRLKFKEVKNLTPKKKTPRTFNVSKDRVVRLKTKSLVRERIKKGK